MAGLSSFREMAPVKSSGIELLMAWRQEGKEVVELTSMLLIHSLIGTNSGLMGTVKI